MNRGGKKEKKIATKTYPENVPTKRRNKEKAIEDQFPHGGRPLFIEGAGEKEKCTTRGWVIHVEC